VTELSAHPSGVDLLSPAYRFARLFIAVYGVEIFRIFRTRPYVIRRGKIVELERSDLQNASNAIQMEDERSREQCQCDWEYATSRGTQRAHNPLCRVHGASLIHVTEQTGVTPDGALVGGSHRTGAACTRSE
jgi:hypothetical protein